MSIGHACPRCGAAAGRFCIRPDTEPHVTHLARRALNTRYAGRALSSREERELKRFGLPTFQLDPPRSKR